ncbi:hypothetical protein K450DRAFT_226586 [Umbelopsis ramanniana AG]|uniref:Uncharacterized protein n=1 Tax=Umbelopsis ramanniana AG TaxID=1314678 RepID=A0AAD5EG31_UMBRA|nr:uncharacterized protein K450DRAFT_226586 [Umbelopsis ramanniana AG]KAI8582717.1 hypothetical protein K450DRAFT_226586 [Umbelopsis ramanniana AG]
MTCNITFSFTLSLFSQCQSDRNVDNLHPFFSILLSPFVSCLILCYEILPADRLFPALVYPHTHFRMIQYLQDELCPATLFLYMKANNRKMEPPIYKKKKKNQKPNVINALNFDRLNDRQKNYE